ncbi:MAG: hypothetical protein ACI4NN_03310, partial [Pyramidobacter sp.]
INVSIVTAQRRFNQWFLKYPEIIFTKYPLVFSENCDLIFFTNIHTQTVEAEIKSGSALTESRQ